MKKWSRVAKNGISTLYLYLLNLTKYRHTNPWNDPVPGILPMPQKLKQSK